MKKIFLLAVILTASFGVNLYSEEGCSNCSDPICDTLQTMAHSIVKSSPATIDTLGLKTLIDKGVPLIILDARSGKLDDGKRLPGALSLNAESKPEEIAKVIPSKDALVVTYCSNPECPASHKLYTHLNTLGYTNLIEYPEGIQGWVEAGNPVTATK